MTMRIFLFILLLCTGLLNIPAYGISGPDELLSNPQQEKRAERIGAQLRCPVCQNESIEDSDAELARDLRKIVRQHVQAGQSDQQIITWMVERYGNFIRLSPPFNPITALLWFTPVLALGMGGLIALVFFRKHAKEKKLPPLSPSEQKRLETLMKDS